LVAAQLAAILESKTRKKNSPSLREKQNNYRAITHRSNEQAAALMSEHKSIGREKSEMMNGSEAGPAMLVDGK
jgi:hypothetical protein